MYDAYKQKLRLNKINDTTHPLQVFTFRLSQSRGTQNILYIVFIQPLQLHP